MRFTYPACFYRQPDTPNGYTVEVPDLPGCVTEGTTLADAVLMATDAASGWVLDELEDGRNIPLASAIEDITPDVGGFTTILVLDMDEYARKYGHKVVRKSITIPAYLNTFAEARNVNFSQVLGRALEDLYAEANGRA